MIVNVVCIFHFTAAKPYVSGLRRGPKVAPQRGTKAYLEWKYKEETRPPPYWSKFTSKKKLKDWNLAVKGGAAHMEAVDQTTHQSIETAFKHSMGGSQIVSIHRIENVELFLKYSEECQRLFRKAIVEGAFVDLSRGKGSSGPAKTMQHLHQDMHSHTYPEINEYYFFHGTKPGYVSVITGQGLDNRLAGPGLLGTGVYGAEDAAKSSGYTGKSNTHDYCLQNYSYHVHALSVCVFKKNYMYLIPYHIILSIDNFLLL